MASPTSPTSPTSAHNPAGRAGPASAPSATSAARHTARLSADAWESLFRTQVAVMRRLQPDSAFKQLTMREYDVLFNLTRCPSGWTRLKDLNEHLLLSQPSLSRMLDRLEAKGLVRRRPAAMDQRGIELALTPQGAELQRRIGLAHISAIRDILEPAMEPAELEQLLHLTEKLRISLEDG